MINNMGGILISISQRREHKTNEIIDAAEKVFFSQGFDKTTMENIAAELELTKPALYRYFKNKKDLYYAVILRGTGFYQK
jgi:AcrR family transcriptional regulator